ncbi:PilX N-terminal domain-containing pilus assembly protein [Frateuria hangzhouensis]|uniref:PilX N-terminal domain-containing pilus assembly protein n=1 Tax=Frateuria hangzhouensis TaxID=2995589 RepID=UPI002260EDD1|nr:PilX N-terminal domain-containing pilus assembly protein [Frateuria sp. STR12]MCX7514769.1 PilX N-terminal domain-containing pilus assembly protein [Frateuria sp. STR12]
MTTIRSGQRGIALFVGLVFLVVLSLVAVIAMRGTLMEMRLVTNVARHQQAFETSETLRAVPIALFDEHVFQRGWPEQLGGTLPDDDFDFGLTDDMLTVVKDGLQTNCSSEVDLFYGNLEPACGGMAAENRYDTTSWHPDAVLSMCDVTSSSCSRNVSATVSIVPDGTVLAEGSGGAQAAGYRGIGGGAAAGGGSMYFEVMSVGTVPGDGRAVTMAQYRQSIRN